MRKLLSVIALVALAAGVWLAARSFTHRGELKATIVFDDGHGIRKGDPVVADGVVVGRVVRVDDVDSRKAVTVRLDRAHRRAIVTDSLFAVDHDSLVVTNAFAVGAPVEDGALLHAKEDRVSRWLARHGKAVGSVVQKARERADELIDHDFDEWTAKVPGWKREGSDAFARHLAEAKQQVEKAEADLRSRNRAEEARKLKERFEKWMDEATR